MVGSYPDKQTFQLLSFFHPEGGEGGRRGDATTEPRENTLSK
jgi:hypothetical protein